MLVPFDIDCSLERFVLVKQLFKTVLQLLYLGLVRVLFFAEGLREVLGLTLILSLRLLEGSCLFC